MKKIISFANIPLRISVSEFKYKSIHYHPGVLELLFALEGEMAVTIGQRSVFLKEGEFMVINAGCLHAIHSDKICTSVSIYFDLDAYSQMLPYIRGVRFHALRHLLPPEKTGPWLKLRNFFIRIMLMHNKNTHPAQKIMHDLSDKVIQLLWEEFQDRQELPEHVLERYYSISRYLHENYRGDISVAQVAKRENISVTRLAHFWKDASGYSIRQSITWLRLQDAEKMLLETSLTINDIAYQCGFSDEKYFYQHFKKRYKTTPNEYRIRHLENQRQTVRVLLSRRESEQRVAVYAMRYYTRDLPDYIALTPEEEEKERILQYLYNAILTNTELFLKQFSVTGQDAGYMQIAPDRALFYKDGEYLVNWEYIYAQMHIFLDMGLRIIATVEFDIMPLEQWKPIMSSIVDELLTIWGKTVIEQQEYIIHFKDIASYSQCSDLVQFLQERTPICKAQAIFTL